MCTSATGAGVRGRKTTSLLVNLLGRGGDQRHTEAGGDQAGDRLTVDHLLRNARQKARIDAALADIAGECGGIRDAASHARHRATRASGTWRSRASRCPFGRMTSDLFAPCPHARQFLLRRDAAVETDIGAIFEHGFQLQAPGPAHGWSCAHRAMALRYSASSSASPPRRMVPVAPMSILPVRPAPMKRTCCLRLLDLRQDGPRLNLQLLPRRGQFHAAAGAGEQLGSEGALKLLNLLRKRRLGHVQPFRRPGKGQLLGDGEKIAELAQIHRQPY